MEISRLGMINNTIHHVTCIGLRFKYAQKKDLSELEKITKQDI